MSISNGESITPISETDERQPSPENNIPSVNFNETITDEQLLNNYLEDLTGQEIDFVENCQDGTHYAFAQNLNDQLVQLAEGYADRTPSVLLDDVIEDTDTSTAENSSNKLFNQLHSLNSQNMENEDPQKFGSVSSASKRKKLPAWMNEADEVVDETDEQEIYKEHVGNGSHHRGGSYVASSKGTNRSNKLPAWMMAASQEEVIMDDTLVQCNDIEVPYGEYMSESIDNHESIGSGGPGSHTESWQKRSQDGYSYSKKSSRSRIQNSSQRSDDSARWTQNRSYFLRMQKQKQESSDNREWAKLANKATKQTPTRSTTKASTRAIIDELDESRMLLCQKERDIHELQEQINQLQEAQIQEECDRVEAEIGKERATNENRQLNAEKNDLTEKINALELSLRSHEKELQETQSAAKLERVATSARLEQLETELQSTRGSAYNLIQAPDQLSSVDTTTAATETINIVPASTKSTDVSDMCTQTTISDFQVLAPSSSSIQISSPYRATGDKISTQTVQSIVSSSSSLSGDTACVADDEQTIITMTPGRMKSKPKIELPVETPKMESKPHFGSMLWHRLGTHGNILNRVARPILAVCLLQNVDNVPVSLLQAYGVVSRPKSIASPSRSASTSKTSSSHQIRSSTSVKRKMKRGFFHKP